MKITLPEIDSLNLITELPPNLSNISSAKEKILGLIFGYFSVEENN